MTTLTGESIGVVVTRRVPAANVEAFETALRELMQIASKKPGRIAGDVLRGAVRRGEREYFIVYRFADEARLRAWEASPERLALVGHIDPLTVGGCHRELTGLEAGFDLPPGTAYTPVASGGVRDMAWHLAARELGALALGAALADVSVPPPHGGAERAARAGHDICRHASTHKPGRTLVTHQCGVRGRICLTSSFLTGGDHDFPTAN
jgi:heme-degrading monooxygenase HmoA